MQQLKHERQKMRLVKRILNYSFIYQQEQLETCTIIQLQRIQKKLLIANIIKHNYKNRHHNNKLIRVFER